MLNGRISGRNAGVYIIVQCIGAIIASALLLAIMTGNPAYSLAADGIGQNGYGAASPGGFSLSSGLLAEVVLTFMFLTVIFGATSKAAPAGFAGIAIGLSLTVIHLVGIPITGTSVNPARSLGPALVAGGRALTALGFRSRTRPRRRDRCRGMEISVRGIHPHGIILLFFIDYR